MIKIASLLLGGVVLLSGCSEEQKGSELTPVALPECPDSSYGTCDVRSADCQKQLLELAACVYGSEAPPSLPVSVVSVAQFRTLLEQSASEEQAQRQPRDELAREVFEGALHDLGLAAQDAFSDEASIDSILQNFVGVYLDAEQGIILVDQERTLDDVNADALLIHEFVHALQDADYALDGWIEPYATRTDSLLAARAVTEGQATYYQFRAAAAMFGYDSTSIDFPATFDGLRADLLEVAQQDPSPYVASAATFPYGYGASLAHAEWEALGQGFESELFDAPPTTTSEVMQRAAFPGRSYTRQEPIELEAPPEAEGYSLLDEDVLGAWMVKLLLATHGVPFDETWQEVRVDHLWLYADEQGQGAWLWEVDTSDLRVATMVGRVRTQLPASLHVETANGRIFFASQGAPQFLLDAGQAFLDAGAP